METPQNNQIYVGDLPVTTDEGFLRQLFDDCGAIPPNGIILKKHKTLEKSFAFITFETHEAAAHAITDLNYTKLDGVPIRISWNDPETKKIRNSVLGNLFIRGLDESIEVSQLHDAFSNFGEIISCKIPMTDGKSRGYGYIQYRNPADAEKARIDLQYASINGKTITIEPYVIPTRRNPYEIFTNVFVKAEGRNAKLPYKNNEELAKVFEPFGEIQNARLILDENNESKGFGFCNFKCHEDAFRAVGSLNGVELDGVKLFVGRAMPRNERKALIRKNTEEYHIMVNAQTKGRNIYVKNFGPDVTEEEFEEYFKQFGEVEKFKVARTPQEPFESKGFGHVLYSKVEEANKAIMETLRTPLKGSKLFVTLLKTKEDRIREKAKETRLLNQQKEMSQQLQMAQKQGFVPMQQMAPATPMQMPPMMGSFSSFKDLLEQKLLDRDITGEDLMKKLSSVSEEQAKILCENQEILDEWSGRSFVLIESFKDSLKQELLDRGITGKELKKKLSSVSNDQAKYLCNDQARFEKWLQY